MHLMRCVHEHSPSSHDLHLHMWYRHRPQPEPFSPCCSSEPNDACDAPAVAAWLQFADWCVEAALGCHRVVTYHKVVGLGVGSV